MNVVHIVPRMVTSMTLCQVLLMQVHYNTQLFTGIEVLDEDEDAKSLLERRQKNRKAPEGTSVCLLINSFLTFLI